MENTAFPIEIKEAFATYTGGNIWLFYGTLENGSYFLTDDYGSTLFLDADPSNLDESTYEEWQKEHLIVEPPALIQKEFCNLLIKKLLEYDVSDNKHRGGITNTELKSYQHYFSNILY